MPYYRSIQALRFIAALMVVVFHVADGPFVVGAAGVDIFFVISGFIMGTIGVRETPRTFLTKRVIRLVPLYWAVTLLMCAVSLLGVFTLFTADIRRLVLSLLFIPYYEPDGSLWPLVVVGWTLNVEMLFYALFAAGLAFGAPVRIAVSLLAALALAGAIFDPQGAVLRQWTTPLLLEFAAGLTLATVVRPRGLVKGLVLLGLGVVWLAGIGTLDMHAGAWRLLSWGVPAVLVVAGALAIERVGRWPAGLRTLEIGGDASYSLYLMHGMVIAVSKKIIGTSLPGKVAACAIAVLVSLMAYRFFERPVGAALSRLASNGMKTPSKSEAASSRL